MGNLIDPPNDEPMDDESVKLIYRVVSPAEHSVELAKNVSQVDLSAGASDSLQAPTRGVEPDLSSKIDAANSAASFSVPPQFFRGVERFKQSFVEIAKLVSLLTVPEGLFSDLSRLAIPNNRFPKSGPLLADPLKARRSDRDAAERLARRIPWRPTGWKGEAITLRAKHERRSVESLMLEAMVESVIRNSGRFKEPLPIFLLSNSRQLSTSDGSRVSTRPEELDLCEYWEWIREESVRAAEQQLLGFPHVPAVIVSSPPTDDESLRIASVAAAELSLPSSSLRGRPRGSGIFQSREEFMELVGFAVRELRGLGQRPTQEAVAGKLAFKGYFAASDPARQIRRCQGRFGFANWLDLLSHF